jgi:hypothetical protein
MELETKAITIMPGTSQTHDSLNLCKRAVETHSTSCKASLLFLDNSCDNQAMRDHMEEYVESFGYAYQYLDRPFSWSKLCNYGTTQIGKGFDYVSYSNADVVFHAGWLHYLLELWNQDGNRRRYFSVHPYAYSPQSGGHQGQNYRMSAVPNHKLVECDHPLMHVSTFRKVDGFVWDESFNLYNADCDFWMWLRVQGLTCAVGHSSRVDHVCGQIVSHIQETSSGHVDLGGAEEFYAKWKVLLDIDKCKAEADELRNSLNTKKRNLRAAKCL